MTPERTKSAIEMFADQLSIAHREIDAQRETIRQKDELIRSLEARIKELEDR